MTNFYELEAPTSWAATPDQYSFSSLQAIESCPRKWQFLRSEWGAQGRFPERPHPKALEGSIIHEAIEKLVRALGKQGLPSIGSPRFQQAVEDVGFWGFFAVEIDKWNSKLAQHPRSGPYFVLRTPPRELANQAIRLFREQYTALDAEPAPISSESQSRGTPEPDPKTLLSLRGALSETELTHPSLPFAGVIDLVDQVGDGVRVVDFKTGKEKEEHEQQLLLYAVLWWRCSGVVPEELAVQYLNHRRTFPVSEQRLLEAEVGLKSSIDGAQRLLAIQPAEARPGIDCGYCAVRARCSNGWKAQQAAAGRPREGTCDVAVTATAAPSPSGFLAMSGTRDVDVVYDAAVGRHLPAIEEGSHLRLLDAIARDDGRTFEVRPWTEVYVARSED